MANPGGSSGSRLFYAGSGEEVCLGDRVRIRRWLRSDLDGTVCYIPGLSRVNRSIESDEVRQWGVRLADGTVLLTIYAPEQVQPRKSLEFVARGQGGELEPDEELL